MHWSHDKLGPDSEPAGFIPEKHHGDLETAVIHFNTTFGLSSNINIDITSSFGERWMDYNAENETIHHRNESTRDSMGTYMNTTIIARYLLLNQTFGPGKRFFLGLGLVVPSNNALKTDPYILAQNLQRHTHFAISDGNLKGIFELQYFNRKKGLFFYGATLRYDKTLKINEFGFKSGDLYSYNGFIFLHHQKILNYVSPFLIFTINHKNKDFWSGSKYVENSDGGYINLGLGINKKINSYKINFIISRTITSWITPGNDEAKQINSNLESYVAGLTVSKVISF